MIESTEGNSNKEGYFHIWFFKKGYEYPCRVNFDSAYSYYFLTCKRSIKLLRGQGCLGCPRPNIWGLKGYDMNSSLMHFFLDNCLSFKLNSSCSTHLPFTWTLNKKRKVHTIMSAIIAGMVILFKLRKAVHWPSSQIEQTLGPCPTVGSLEDFSGTLTAWVHETVIWNYSLKICVELDSSKWWVLWLVLQFLQFLHSK